MNKKTDYALRIIRALTDQNRHTAAELAGNEQIPLAFTYKILKQLSRAGIISLERGPGGGCSLQTDLKQISLYDSDSDHGRRSRHDRLYEWSL